jgi:hypothetical protein
MDVFGSSPATITALSAVGGSLVGAMGSTFSAWIAQSHQDRRDLVAKKIAQREQLYSDFIGESARLMVDAVQNSFQDPTKLIPVYALMSRIRLSSSPKVVESAERLIASILNAYVEPNLTPEQIRSIVFERGDPLSEFSNVCRCELESLWSSSPNRAPKY